jgi:uncharacterized iron-regulated protein
MRSISFLSLFIPFCIIAQTPALDSKALSEGLKKHISTIASDKYEGRETGTKGEQMTVDYISAQFKNIGLQPKGTSGYIQKFTFTDGIKTETAGNKMSIDNAPLTLEKDWLPLPYSSGGKANGAFIYVGYGISAPNAGHDDYKDKQNLGGKIFVMETSTPDPKDSVKFKDQSDFRSKIDLAISKGAAAVIFISSDASSEAPKFKHKEMAKIAQASIPVVFVTGAISGQLKSGKPGTVSIETNLVKIERTGQNVAGFLDNKAPYTIIIGAHLDHLGYGDEENSLYKGAPAIHNGADDNASGTAAVIEMAKYIAAKGPKSNNYLFICFSGEEKGLIGSNYYAKNPTIDLSVANYMINMDMIGRLKKDERTLAVYGTGTSPMWNKILPEVKVDSIKIKTIESGIGPSDHTSFYLKNIPVLHFFSGFHADYHKPTDDEEKINYDGEVSIVKYILTIINMADGKGKLEFTKTKDEAVSSKNVGRPKVTLGIVPDYMYSGEGMKVDGVTEGKPAAEAGLKAGDLITQIGDHKVVDMQSYMKALSNFTAGDKTKVKIKRGAENLEMDVKFGQPKIAGILSEKNYRIYSAKLNKEVTLDDIIEDMQNYNVLFYGEEHNDSVTHYLEKTVFEKMTTKYGDKTALSMEMFDRDVQNVMNEYLKGFIREKNFIRDARVWSNYRDYKPMVERAKEKKLDVVCANAPSRYTNLAGRKGQAALKDLPAESKVFFAPLPYDTAQGKYYDKLIEMSGHTPAKNDTAKAKPAMPMGMPFNLIVAQSLWDATMAYSISEYLKKNPAKKVMQVNGRFHSDQGFAVATQLKKYSPKTKALIISTGPDPSFPNIDWSKFKELGDYIIITDPAVPKTFEN